MTRTSCRDLVTVVDEENGRLLSTCKSTTELNDDPEKRSLTMSNVVIVYKALGTNDESVERDETISDPSPMFKRMMELGINPTALAK